MWLDQMSPNVEGIRDATVKENVEETPTIKEIMLRKGKKTKALITKFKASKNIWNNDVIELENLKGKENVPIK